MLLVPFDDSGPGSNEMMVDYAERAWEYCVASLPIWSVIHFTIGTYDFQA